MSVKSTVICDVCGKERQQTNHWWTALVSSAGWWTIKHYDDNDNYSGLKHLCGQACVHTMVDAWMSSGAQAAQTVPAIESSTEGPMDAPRGDEERA